MNKTCDDIESVTYAEEFGCTNGKYLRVFAETNESVSKRLADCCDVLHAPGPAYIVETPASMAEDNIRAERHACQQRDQMMRAVCSQHCRPIKKAKRTTGAVYWPSELYDGCVTG